MFFTTESGHKKIIMQQNTYKNSDNFMEFRGYLFFMLFSLSLSMSISKKERRLRAVFYYF